MTWRHLWRKRIFTFLNIFGLAVGIASCWVIFKICSHEFSYEKNIPGVERTYRVITQMVRNDRMAYNGGVAAPLYQGIREELTGWEYVVPVFEQWVNTVHVNRTDTESYSEDEPGNIIRVDASYFEMLPYKWILGSPESSFNEINQVVLTKSRAQAYFPDTNLEDILNKQIIYEYFDTTYVQVSGIVEDLIGPTEFVAKEFIFLPNQVYENYEWTNTNGSDKLYIKLHAQTESVDFLNQIEVLDNRRWTSFERDRGSDLPKTKSYQLLSLMDSHFFTEITDPLVPPKISKTVLYSLIVSGIFLLLLACINYINMSIAQIPERAKEIGVRKTMGGSSFHLIWQFLSETLFTAFFACLGALFLNYLGFLWLSDVIPEGVTPTTDLTQFLLFSCTLILIIVLIAGVYPAWMVTQVRTIEVFKKNTGSFSMKNGKLNLQKFLILFQFTVAIIFVSATLIVGAQLRHTLKSDLGFDKEAVVLIDIPFKYWYDNPNYSNKQFTLLEELRRESGIKEVSLAAPPLSGGYSSTMFKQTSINESLQQSNNLEVLLFKKTIDSAYLNLYNIDLLAGRNIRASDTLQEYLINESAAKALGYTNPEDAVGKMIQQRGQASFPIVGVTRDFHTQSFFNEITPVILMTSNSDRHVFNIKLAGGNADSWQSTLVAIKNHWQKFYPPEIFQYKFYDETIEAFYHSERKSAKLINLASVITLMISCLGLLGLAALSTNKRTKEIGVRKVLGASVAGIITMLSMDFIKLVLLATVIASPIAWWAMNYWLEDFVYRIEIQWWMFGLSGLVAVVIALFTVASQALKAALANPVESLRDE